MKVIALGSSFAAGPGIDPQTDKDAGRSGNNYPNLFARKLGVDVTSSAHFVDLTVSGATLLNVLSEPQETGGKTFPSQLSLLPEDDPAQQTIITVTGGGNDMFYVGSMFDRTLKGTWWGRLLGFFLSAEKKGMLDSPSIASPEEVVSRFQAILEHLHSRFPTAYILLLEYFAVVGPDTKAGTDVVFSQDQIQGYLHTADTLKDIYAQAARGRDGVYVVPLADESRDAHAIGSRQPWVNNCSLWNFYKGGAFHPNLAGMQAAADRLFEFYQKLSVSPKNA